jgi:hypothetical protein
MYLAGTKVGACMLGPAALLWRGRSKESCHRNSGAMLHQAFHVVKPGFCSGDQVFWAEVGGGDMDGWDLTLFQQGFSGCCRAGTVAEGRNRKPVRADKKAGEQGGLGQCAGWWV